MSKPINRLKGISGGVSAKNNNNLDRTENLTPGQLVKSFKTGDPSAFNLIVKRKNAQLTSFLFKMLKSHEDAEEIANDVFIHIWQNKDYISEDLPFDGLLFSIAYRRAINRIKERERFMNLLIEEYHTPMDYADSPEHIAEMNEVQEKIDKAIDEMPASMKRIYTMKFQEGLSNEQIAKEMSISQSTIRVQILNAEKRIRKAVETVNSAL